MVGPVASGHGSQIHALGVRTDRATAFDEGFAEHLQAMAIEHPEAAPTTAALARDGESSSGIERRLESYRKELTARFAPAPILRRTRASSRFERVSATLLRCTSSRVLARRRSR